MHSAHALYACPHPYILIYVYMLYQQQLQMQESPIRPRQKPAKTIIINIDYNYPFQLPLPPLPNPQSLKITRILSKSELSRNKHLSQKLHFIQKLRNRHLIKIQQIYEYKENIHINYQYIGNVLQINKYDIVFWNLIQKQLENFITYLGNVGVKCDIVRERMGITGEGVFKYYVGMEFGIDQGLGQEDLEIYYKNVMKEIKMMYFPQDRTRQVVPYKKQNTIVPVPQSKLQKNRKQSLLTLPPDKIQHKVPNFYNKMKNIVEQMNNYRHALMTGSANASSLQKYQSNGNIDINRDMNNMNMNMNANMNMSTNMNTNMNTSINTMIHTNMMNIKSSGNLNIVRRNGKDILRKLSQNGDIFKKDRKQSTKYSDYKSQVVNKNKQKQVRQQIITKYQKFENKSRVEQLKVQQYTQITKRGTKYLQDFLPVLQDDLTLRQSNTNTKNETTIQSHNPTAPTTPTNHTLHVPHLHSSYKKKRIRESSTQHQLQRSRQLQISKQLQRSKQKSKSNEKISHVSKYLNKEYENNQLILYQCQRSQMDVEVGSQVQMLKSKVQQSIHNTLKLIRKFKGIC